MLEVFFIEVNLLEAILLEKDLVQDQGWTHLSPAAQVNQAEATRPEDTWIEVT